MRELSINVDNIFARRLALRIGQLNAIGEQEIGSVSLAQLGIEGIIGTPEGRAVGNPGDIRIRLDAGEIWMKSPGSGERTKIGWELKGRVGPPGPQGVQGPQGPVGSSGSMQNAKVNLPSGGASGARVNAGIPTVLSGVASQTSPTATNLLTSLSRTRATIGPGADLIAGWRSDFALWWRGNAAGLGGFDVRWRFALASFVAGFRAFYGFRDDPSEIPGTLDPSLMTSFIGMGLDAGDTQWSLMHSDENGPATVIPLGAAFNVATTDAMSLQLSADPNGADVDWIARNLSTGQVQSGTIVSNMPASDNFLASHQWASTGDDATTALFNELIDIVSVDPVP